MVMFSGSPRPTSVRPIRIRLREAPAFENVGDMTALPATGFTVIAMPMKIGGGSGGPLRVAAILN